eukprot:gb/GECH01014164.1/.p1 GENE.gb/GECH01014164.1/~~gb/GECH01014164.1/.p1  ORF type:complete len:347 (+),score=93.03 gb/GECH01014164.1/:1-1041(+)
MKKNNQTDETTTENYNQISSRFASDMKTKKRRGPRKSYKNRRLNVDPFLLQQQIKQKLSTDTLWASDVKFTWKKTVADSNNGKKGSSFLFATARPKYSSDFKVYCPPTVDFDHHGNNSINDSTSKTWAFNTNSNETTKSNVNGELNYDINSMRKDNYNYNYQTLNNNYITKNNSNNFTTTQNTLNTQNDRNHHYNNYNNYNTDGITEPSVSSPTSSTASGGSFSSSGEPEPLSIYNKHHLDGILRFRKGGTNTLDLMVVFTNKGNSPVENFVLSAAVPKYMMHKMLPQSGDVISPQGGQVTQRLKIKKRDGAESKPYMLRIKVDGTLGSGEKISEVLSVNDFPRDL